MDVLFPIVFGVSLFLVFGGIIFVFISIFSPKFRGKMMSKQIKAAKYMLDETRDDLESMGSSVGEIGINIQKNVLDNKGDTLKDISRKNAEIEKEAIEIKSKALRDGLIGNVIYCKYCGTSIDKDSKFCKNCGKEQ